LDVVLASEQRRGKEEERKVGIESKRVSVARKITK
jgi:hypothetical protein